MRPDAVLNQKAFPVFPTGRIAARSFPEMPTARGCPAVARIHSSAKVEAIKFAGDALPVSPAVPMIGLAPSPTQLILAPVFRSYHSLDTMPWPDGRAPVEIVACPGPVTVWACE